MCFPRYQTTRQGVTSLPEGVLPIPAGLDGLVDGGWIGSWILLSEILKSRFLGWLWLFRTVSVPILSVVALRGQCVCVSRRPVVACGLAAGFAPMGGEKHRSAGTRIALPWRSGVVA